MSSDLYTALPLLANLIYNVYKQDELIYKIYEYIVYMLKITR